jgi:predicted short-subunit dehydrogenase-like oxidoreductase (DUF2520 family)
MGEVRRLSVAVVGAGRLGTALGVLLEAAGHRVVAASGREASSQRVRRFLRWARFVPAEEAHQAARSGRVVILAVPDDLIAPTTSDIAGQGGFSRGQHVIHLSGSVGLSALAPARALGAQVLSMHPLQSIPDVEEGIRRLPGSSMAVTAETDQALSFGCALAEAVGCRPFALADDVKPLYHAAAVFCSNYLVAVIGMAEHLFRLAGLDDPIERFAPLAAGTLEATLSRGPAEALTGPAARGDAGTVARNLTALAATAPEAVPAYVALAEVAAGIAARSGRLSKDATDRLREVLDRWR